jgi:polysaccharide chain length determinant protein (PEP-CTERM system associated)
VLPGKSYKPEDILAVAWRRRWWILIPFVVVALATFGYARWLPDLYRSETLILIIPQRVPESYVRSTVTTRIEDRLRSISQQILSRTRLEPIIRAMNLYPGPMNSGLVEDAIARMRRDIDVNVVKGDAFRVSFLSSSPSTSMKVAQQLASLFIDENLKDREVLAEDTSQFLESQLASTKTRLIENEKRLEEYRRRYSGQLPTQVQSNLQVLQHAQLQIQALNDSIARDRDRKMMLENQVAQQEIPGAAAVRVGGGPAPTSPSERPITPGPAAVQLDAAVAALRSMELQYKPEHPDVIHQKRVIEELREKAQAEQLLQTLQRPATPNALIVTAPLDRAEEARFDRMAQTRAEIESVDRQIAAKEKDLDHLNSVVADYQARVEAVPTRESELVELTRDYDTIQKQYVTLSAKKEEAQLSANLERRQIGEQFKVLDPARLPEKPFSPNRPRINLIGVVIGLVAGLALGTLIEYRDSTIRTDEEVVESLSLPVLALIPVMTTVFDRARQRRIRLLVSTAVLFIATAAAGIVFWTVRS